MNPFYKHGQDDALRKLGFIHLIDTEDLPDFLQETKKKQLYSLYTLNSAGGRPAGGLIQMPDSYRMKASADRTADMFADFAESDDTETTQAVELEDLDDDAHARNNEKLINPPSPWTGSTSISNTKFPDF